MPTALHNAANWSEIGQIEIIGRLAEIGRVLQLPDAEILLASTNVHELNAFCHPLQSEQKVGCVRLLGRDDCGSLQPCVTWRIKQKRRPRRRP